MDKIFDKKKLLKMNKIFDKKVVKMDKIFDKERL